MRILMATTKLYLPQFYGGAEISIHSMCLMLQEAGHDVAVLASLASKGLLTWRNRFMHQLQPAVNFPADHELGYPVFRGWKPCDAASEIMKRFSPDVIIAQSGEVLTIADAFSGMRLPTFVFFRHTHVKNLGAEPRADSGFMYFANSQFTAKSYRAAFGLECQVVTPLVIPRFYRTKTDRSRVVFINPNPMKGIARVLELAERRPDIPFDVVESWKLPKWMVAESKARAAKLGNIRWLRSKTDMRSVYRHARILLAPSGIDHPEWIESWGRVATEAHLSGIPVIATNDGGLPESVGPGGILIARTASIEDWLSALDLLWNDAQAYDNYSRAALHYSTRESVNPEQQIKRFVLTLEARLEGQI